MPLIFAGGRNAGDPQTAEVALFLLTADVGLLPGLHDLFLRRLKQIGA